MAINIQWPDCAKRLRAARQRKGLTVRQVAETIGVTAGSWRKWESGTMCPFFQNAIAAATAVGLTAKQLAGIR